MPSKIISFRNQLRMFTAGLISILPFNILRIFLYRILLGYKISFKAKIKFGTMISVDKVKIGKCFIGRFCIFEGPYTVEIGNKVIIGFKNQFRCGDWVVDKEHVKGNYLRYLKIGDGVHIGKEHYFDTTGGIEIKKGTWIAGNGSQFWSHGIGVRERNVTIGEECYIASGVRFAPGASIGNNCLVLLGSVITKPFPADNMLIGSAPSRVIQANYNWKRYKEEGEAEVAAEPAKEPGKE